MAKEEQEKILFIMQYRTYCYITISLGLKNTGATYQRLVNRLFQGQIGRNIEVYMDDMLINSKTQGQFNSNLRKKFNILR